MDQDIWQNILDQLEDKIAIDSFKTWFSETELIDKNKDSLVIRVPTKFAAEYLNKNYSEMISDISYAIYKKKYSIKFSHNYTTEKTIPRPEQINNVNLNHKYTFSDFVVGKSNNFAHSAAMAVAETPGAIYNPLFIYGESGMGKTHLMQAIGHFCLEESKDCNVFYITTEQFTNEMIEAIRTNTTQQFRNKFRNIDLLLVDRRNRLRL
jgi:chromosomal replication initiator protein